MTAATAATFFFSAVAAVGWAYVGDRSNRKPLLMLGTLIWAAGTFATPFAPNFAAFLGAQIVGGIGLGAVGSVGFSVVSDLIGPAPARRRHELLGAVAGRRHAGRHAARRPARRGRLAPAVLRDHGRRPGGHGGVPVHRTTSAAGQSEPQLAAVYAAGGDYDYRISRADLPDIARRRTNLYLILQGFLGQLVFGSFVLLPALFQAKAQALGYSREHGHRDRQPVRDPVPARRRAVDHRRHRRRPRPAAPARGRALVAGDRHPGRRRRSSSCCSSCRCAWTCPTAPGSARSIGGVLGSIVTEPVMAAQLPVRAAGPGPDVGERAELVRARRRGQPARAPGHGLQPRSTSSTGWAARPATTAPAR